MLKANTKPKVVKPKTKHHKVIPSYTQHHKTKKMGFFPNFPHATAMAQNSAIPRPLYSSGGGIPYTSTFESYGITNKPPYFLQSLIAKTTQSDYEIPVKPETSSTKTGMNPMNGNEGKRKQFPEQGKTEAIQYVDLVAPAKSQNIDNQPDYIALQPSKQPIKEKLMERAEYRKKNEIPVDVKVSSIMKKEKMNEKRKEYVKKKTSLRGKKNEEL
jgi:hypothetical protein